MKAVLASFPADLAEQRKRSGLDRWDEMWEGVLHVPPMLNIFHQDLEWALETWLRLHWAPLHEGKVYHQVNLASIGGWPKDYRIPDLVLLRPERFAINRIEYFEGAPDVVVEIQSPGDETEDKMPFYFGLGVPEVWVIQRDSRAPAIHVRQRGRYRSRSPLSNGWLRSQVTGVEMTAEEGALAIRLAGDDSTRQLLSPG